MKDYKYNLSDSAKSELNLLINEVLEDFKPSKKEIEETKVTINEIMGRLKQHSPKDVEILLAGSVARGTQIKGRYDIDIFLLFPRKMSEELVEKKGLEIGKAVVNRKNNESCMVKYAEHPYTRLLLNDKRLNFDIVPAYKITNAKERGTAVDRTQLHNEFVNSNLSEKQKDDVRVLKVLLKSHHVYGAEAKTEGFSGYLCELLIYHYGSFTKLVTGIANSKAPIVINTAKTTGETELSALVKRFGKNIVVIDPTDSNRNVAANVSDESLFRFMLVARAVTKKPEKELFLGKGYSNIDSGRKLLGLKNRFGANVYLLHFRVPDIAQDIIWQQLKKTRLRLETLLEENGFRPIISLQNSKETDAVMGFFISNIHIHSMKIIGPNIHMAESVERFMKAHENSILVSVEKDRLYSIEKAKYSDPEELIRYFASGKSEKLPSYLKPKNSSLYINDIPEKHAKLLYEAYVEKVSI